MSAKIRIFILIFSLPVLCQHSTAQDLTLWYNQPAKNWNQALPVGNGRLGAMVFGEVDNERIQLNEESVWVGRSFDFSNPQSRKGLKEVRELLFEGKYKEAEKTAQDKLMGDKTLPSSYQTLGDLELIFPKFESITEYKRDLNISNAIASVSFKGDDVTYKRAIFSSAPHQVLVIRLTADQAEKLDLTARLKRDGDHATITAKNNEIILTENVRVIIPNKPSYMDDGGGVLLYTRMMIKNEGGKISTKGNSIQIEKANSITIYLTAATDYNNANPIKVTKDQMSAATAITYDQLKHDHIKEYQQYFNRVNFSLNSNQKSEIPTNIRLNNLKYGAVDPKLIELYYQYGRYLLISSSRPGCLPSNLQGIWAEGLTPPWDADYHININIQMNYWPSEITNLSEMHMPFLKFIDELKKDGQKTAKEMYNMKGAVAHFTTDAWKYTEPHGRTDWAMWPMGLAWCSTHFWEHYLFTGDTVYLRELAYPAMKESAIFCMDWLIEDLKTKKLVSGPSISPENKFVPKSGDTVSVVMGPTMDHMIIWHLLNSTLDAGKILNLDPELQSQIKSTLENLSPVRIAKDGRIMEWSEEFVEAEPGHRHISHLYGLYPGNQITIHTPELLEAARKTIEYRLANGGGHTGWSRAWIINFFARLQDGNAAYQNLQQLLQKSTLENLFDNHPPFQIDGNFGTTAGITEMLLQSHTGDIHLLPALPDPWKKGFIHGLVARGGFEVSIDWENGELQKVTILSKLGSACSIRYGEKVIEFKTKKGKTYVMNSSLTLVSE